MLCKNPSTNPRSKSENIILTGKIILILQNLIQSFRIFYLSHLFNLSISFILNREFTNFHWLNNSIPFNFDMIPASMN